MSQRALRLDRVNLILAFGQPYYAGSGCTAFYVGRKAVGAARRVGVRLDRVVNSAVVEARDGALVTVAHMSRPAKKWKAQ
jgi:hypothetical protein